MSHKTQVAKFKCIKVKTEADIARRVAKRLPSNDTILLRAQRSLGGLQSVVWDKKEKKASYYC